jgi:hypothetical protein
VRAVVMALVISSVPGGGDHNKTAIVGRGPKD